MKKMFIIYTIFVSMLFSNTLEEAKNFSYYASIHYINRDFERAAKMYGESLKIRKNLNLRNEHYITVLKMYIYSQWRINQFCKNPIESSDYSLLFFNNDSDFLYDLKFFENSCISF